LTLLLMFYGTPAGQNFYFIQEDMLKAYAEKSGWTWNVIVSDLAY